MIIKRADVSHMEGINKLLLQVLMVHHEGRPDIFKPHVKKYTDEELTEILKNEETPIFVAVDEKEEVLGYAFCQFIQHKNSNIFTDIKTLYIDDLCVDESLRGQHIGKGLYDYVLSFAKEMGCYNVTLNVWWENKGAVAFYESLGLKPQKIGMERIL